MKEALATGERVWGYTVKGFEKTSLRVEKTSFLFKETSLCGIMPSFQLLSPVGDMSFHLMQTLLSPTEGTFCTAD